MFKRQQAILQLINNEGRQPLDALCARFGVSIQTIRTDIRQLADQGLLLRRHGEALPFPHRDNVSYDQRQILNSPGKQRIAKLCREQLTDFQRLMLGTGSTVARLAQLLRDLKGIQVMTNNLHATQALCDHPDCELLMAGGRVRRRDQDVIGGDALRFFQRYRADVGVVSVGAMDRDGNLYDYNDDEMMAREALVGQCRRRILLIDSSKFDRQASCVAGHLSDFDMVISDQPLPGSLGASLKARQVQLLS
uniref:DeoR/GlpR family DNA-binding transcription regulator n=1 Tax=Marinobacterium profundum TaxID=1714300 RepID=UPI000832D6CA|nr:DeoR/GlpR family DNA-binding transcription regulator [Marinobacterium profundum]